VIYPSLMSQPSIQRRFWQAAVSGSRIRCLRYPIQGIQGFFYFAYLRLAKEKNHSIKILSPILNLLSWRKVFACIAKHN
ncbi:hypothetical protein, partial [Bradyrhizobium sp. NBAIM08]|uniref:hypothetical protein n=1 Tax=Bradyrhizobium sp. NBAIM08 TaxID=2793815 RepID=UPI001CD75C17